MSACTIVAIALSVAGGTAELVGLFLVWREIVSDRERGARLLRKLEVRKRPKRTYPAAPRASSLDSQWAAMASPVSGSAGQMRDVARRIQRIESDVGRGFVKLKQIADAELDRAIQGLEQEAARRDTELRDGLRYVLAGSARQRMLGAALVLAGIVLGTAGSVLGNLA